MAATGSYTRRNVLRGMTLLSVFSVVVSTEPTNITAEPGQTVSLPCQAPDKDPVKVVEWDRTDLKTDGHVLLCRDKNCDPHYQHSTYKNRVSLQEGWKTNGDVSLTLKNVATNDSGTYECHVKTGTNKNIKVSSINLKVVPPGHKSGGDEDGGDEDGGAKSGRAKSGGDKSGSLNPIVALSVVAAALCCLV